MATTLPSALAMRMSAATWSETLEGCATELPAFVEVVEPIEPGARVADDYRIIARPWSSPRKPQLARQYVPRPPIGGWHLGGVLTQVTPARV
jgi:hypothetical protein